MIKRLMLIAPLHVAIMAPYSTFNRYDQTIRLISPQTVLILDTIDIIQLRLWRCGMVDGNADTLGEASVVAKSENDAIREADAVWVVSEVELNLLQGVGKPVSVVSNIHTDSECLPEFTSTSGIVFLGGYKHVPNVDAVLIFHHKILPILRSIMGQIDVTYAGSFPPPEIVALNAPESGINVTGFVEDHRSLLQKHRVAIAPLRYGAGIKGKVGEYMACGVPCVLTTIAAEGFSIKDGVHAEIADTAEMFAERIARLYNDANHWRQIQHAAADYVEAFMSPRAVRSSLECALRQAMFSFKLCHSLPYRIAMRMVRPWRKKWQGIVLHDLCVDKGAPLS